MGLCWVTGISGTGKSTLVANLTALGHRAWDADVGFCEWRHKETRALAPEVDERPDGWLAEHSWFLDVDQVRDLAGRSGDETWFLCGGVENEHEAWSLFAQVVCLVSDDDTIRARLAAREPWQFGHTAEELAHILFWSATIEERYRELGATIIDATQPASAVTAAVLAAVAVA